MRERIILFFNSKSVGCPPTLFLYLKIMSGLSFVNNINI